MAKFSFQGPQGKPPFKGVCSYCKRPGYCKKDYLEVKRQLQGKQLIEFVNPPQGNTKVFSAIRLLQD